MDESVNGFGDGGWRPVVHPVQEGDEGGLGHLVLGPRVDRRGAAEEGSGRPHFVGVGVGRPGHLPRPDPGGVRLLGRGVAELDQVRLGLEHEDGDGRGRCGCARGPLVAEVTFRVPKGAAPPPREWMKMPW